MASRGKGDRQGWAAIAASKRSLNRSSLQGLTYSHSRAVYSPRQRRSVPPESSLKHEADWVRRRGLYYLWNVAAITPGVEPYNTHPLPRRCQHSHASCQGVARNHTRFRPPGSCEEQSSIVNHQSMDSLQLSKILHKQQVSDYCTGARLPRQNVDPSK